jgi:hypothetical protein
MTKITENDIELWAIEELEAYASNSEAKNI